MHSLEKNLLYREEFAEGEAVYQAAQEFCEGYKRYLNEAKTEREAAEVAQALLLENGYREFEVGRRYAPGEKVYYNNRGKSLIAVTIGSQSLEAGMHLAVAHIDCPRLDLKPMPLYEKEHLSLLKTHYYGGIRKYQWVTIPLALHGVFCRPDGSKITLKVGEQPGDPVFCITDLLPHLSKEQNNRKLSEGIHGEELNVIIGSEAIAAEDVKQKVKLRTLQLLYERYGVTERDFISAEIEVVPAFQARDVGFDRGLVGGYGQDDRVNAYTILRAEIDCKAPAFTTVCVLTDKEEIGSVGVTGLDSMYLFDFLKELCAGCGADPIVAFAHSKCLSADVTAAADPTFGSAFEPLNSTYVGRGVGISKYTGTRGKNATNDASAELLSYLTGLLDENGVAWQIGELGAVDQGGGGTIAKFAAGHNIETIDIGVPVLSMHAPFELTSKVDVYMAYKAFVAFANAPK